MSSFDEESLRKLTFSELKKQAKKNGVKVNMPVDKIITSLLEKSNADEDSFVTLERSILNSCKKNKEALFEKDSKRMSETPRRDTYTVDTPLTNTQNINSSFVMASASPELKHSMNESLNVTLSRGSEKKNRKSKRKVSFVTPLRRSTRFSSATPQYNSCKGRPKTPMPSRMSSSTKRVSFTNKENEPETLSVGKAKRPSTPMPLSKQKKGRLSSLGEPLDFYKQCLETNPKVILHRLKEEDLKKISITLTVATPISKPEEKNTDANSPSKLITVTPISQPDVKVTRTPHFHKTTENKSDITPKPSSKKASTLTTKNKMVVTPMPSSKKASALTPGFKKVVTPFPSSDKPKSLSSQGFKKMATPISTSSKKTVTPKSLMKSAVTLKLTSSAVRKSPRTNVKLATTPKHTPSNVKKTPNFNKLHQKAFEKMESLPEYHQRKLLNSQKKKEEQNKFSKKATLEKSKKAPKMFGGISFIPSAAAAKPVKKNLKLISEPKKAPMSQSKALNGKKAPKKAIASNVKAIKSISRENTPLKQRHKFDLRASLARKLPYKPHSGPLKPLNEIHQNSTKVGRTPLKAVQKVETKNPVVTKARIETREVLHGVRKNKRFMLQMNNRNLDVSTQ